MRLALKTASYSLMHFVVAIAVTFAVTGDWRAALAVGLIEPAVQTVAFLLHDRAWAWADRKRDAAAPPARVSFWKAIAHAHP